MGSYAQGDSLTDYEIIPEDEKENSNGTSALGDYAIQVLPELPLDDSLLQGNSSAGIEQPTVIPFASRAINWRRPGTATDPTSSTAYINGYFSSWNVWSFNPVLNAQQNIQNQAKNIDLILRQSKASFAALELNESLIAQEFYNITGDHRKWIDKLWDWESDGRSKVSTLWNWSYKVDDKNTSQDTSISSIRADATLWNTQRYNDIKNIWGVNATQDTNISNVLTNATNWNKDRYTDIKNIWGVNKDQDAAISNVLANATQWNKDRAAEITNLFTAVGELRTANTNRTNEIKTLRTDATQWNVDRYADIKTIWNVNGNQDKAIKNALDSADSWNKDRSGETKNLFIAVGDLKKKDINLDDRLKAIEGFDFGSMIDLTVLVTAINSVGSKVQNLVDLFNVDDEKVVPGTFTFFLKSHIKTQTDAIIQALAMVDESLNDNFVNYFSDWKNGKFWKAFKEFDDFQMAVFFGVFFDNFREEMEKNWVNTLEVWNTTNGYLNSSYNALVIITQWLKQIYEKPGTPAIVNVPPFDYARLEKMLKKLEFGEITNEAGTNIWDFLKSIIDNLGTIITTQLKEFVKVLREILDFLDKLIDKLIGLIVPKNLDFMRTGFDDITLKFNVKFDSFLSIATDVTNMFKPIPKSVVDELSFDLMGVPFVPKLSLLDSFVPKFRNVMALMLWFQTGWWAFRRFTGTGDVVNDN